MKVTEHFLESEFFVPGKCGSVLACDKVKSFFLAKSILEPLRSAIGDKAITVTSGKRSKVHNEKKGGSATSDHLYRDESAAVDIYCGSDFDNRVAFLFAVEELLAFIGQIIAYIDEAEQVRFIHISLPTRKHHAEAMLATYEQPRKYRMFNIEKDERITRP